MSLGSIFGGRKSRRGSRRRGSRRRGSRGVRRVRRGGMGSCGMSGGSYEELSGGESTNEAEMAMQMMGQTGGEEEHSEMEGGRRRRRHRRGRSRRRGRSSRHGRSRRHRRSRRMY